MCSNGDDDGHVDRDRDSTSWLRRARPDCSCIGSERRNESRVADHLTIERLGGLAGFGGPGAKIRGRGRVDLNTLSASDRAAVDALFTRPRGDATPASDAFRYKISRGDEAVDVPEDALPQAVVNAVKDELI